GRFPGGTAGCLGRFVVRLVDGPADAAIRIYDRLRAVDLGLAAGQQHRRRQQKERLNATIHDSATVMGMIVRRTATKALLGRSCPCLPTHVHRKASCKLAQVPRMSVQVGTSLEHGHLHVGGSLFRIAMLRMSLNKRLAWIVRFSCARPYCI